MTLQLSVIPADFWPFRYSGYYLVTRMKTDPLELARSIGTSADKIKNYSVRFTKIGDLAYNEMLIIDYLSDNGDSLQKDIAKFYAISKQTINLSAKKLIEAEYITIYQSPDNKKEKLLRLTDKGNVMKRYNTLNRSKWRKEIINRFGIEKAVMLETLLGEYATITGRVLEETVERDKERSRKFRELEKNEIELWEGPRK